MLEKTVETYLVDRVRAAGGDAYKFTSPQRRSVPDRIVAFPPGRLYFVELKRPGNKPTKPQLREHERLRALGCDVRVIDSREAVDTFVREASAPPAPYLYVYEYPSPFGGTHREFSPTTWNGQQPARTVALYAVPQLVAAMDDADRALLVEASRFGQFDDDFDVPQAKPIRAALRRLCAALEPTVPQPALIDDEGDFDAPVEQPAAAPNVGEGSAADAYASCAGIAIQPAPAPADERPQPNPATAAILFALSLDDGSSIDFLNNWNEGEFDVLRREWPEAPEDVYIGADPFHPATRGGVA